LENEVWGARNADGTSSTSAAGISSMNREGSVDWYSPNTRLREADVPVWIPHVRVAGAERVEAIEGERHGPRAAAAARYGAAVRVNDQERFERWEALARRCEVIPQAARSAIGRAALRPPDVVRQHVGARRHVQLVQAFVEPLVQRAGRFGARAPQLLIDLFTERPPVPAVRQDRRRQRRDERRQHRQRQHLVPDAVEVQGAEWSPDAIPPDAHGRVLAGMQQDRRGEENINPLRFVRTYTSASIFSPRDS